MKCVVDVMMIEGDTENVQPALRRQDDQEMDVPLVAAKTNVLLRRRAQSDVGQRQMAVCVALIHKIGDMVGRLPMLRQTLRPEEALTIRPDAETCRQLCSELEQLARVALHTTDMLENEIAVRPASPASVTEMNNRRHGTSTTCMQLAVDPVCHHRSHTSRVDPNSNGDPDTRKSHCHTQDSTSTSLSCQPSHEEVTRLAEHVNHRWKDVARLLPHPLSEGILANIEQQNGRLSDQFIAMFEEWKRTHGLECTVQALCQALVRAECRLAAEDVFGVRVVGWIVTQATRSRSADHPKSIELFELAKQVGTDWPELAMVLGVSRSEIDVIQMDIRTTREQAIKMLNDWYQREGSQADLNKARSTVKEIRKRDKENLSMLQQQQYESEHLLLKPYDVFRQAQQTAYAMNNLGLCYFMNGMCGKALSILQQAFTLLKASLPAFHCDIATTLNNIGSVYEKTGDVTKAVQLYKECLEIQQQEMPKHLHTASVLMRLGMLVLQQQQYVECKNLLLRSCDILREVCPRSEDMAAACWCLGSVYLQLSKLSEAGEAASESLRMYTTLRPQGHPDIRRAEQLLHQIWQRKYSYIIMVQQEADGCKT